MISGCRITHSRRWGHATPTGPPLDRTLEAFQSVYIRTIPDMPERIAELNKVIEASEYIARKQCVTDLQMAGLLHAILDAEISEIMEKGKVFLAKQEKEENEMNAWTQEAS